MRLEQTLLDESAPPDERWYRHVIYGWNIYSLYEGQPLPGLADAVRVGNQTRVDAEVARIEAALTRMLRALESITQGIPSGRASIPRRDRRRNALTPVVSMPPS
jgi:hypothetical protein